ncbi:baseplate assembly protein [Candidatus Endobugula sertula]|uniref:Baseplate assembly protein n=1 Tax=Candidatus Endobugula sertula TaxID=62101 RepID=A0A1D2QTY3_9GAMM|nr:baseplate assembly protein [Candidatus Endobugula sertula]
MSEKSSGFKQFLGAGWNFPILPSNRDRDLKFANGPDKVRQSIWLILETEPGERIMRPDFGCGLRCYLMKPNNSATRALIQKTVTRALVLWEPRIKLQDVVVTPGQDPSMVSIQILYVHVRDGSPGNLVFPFYL